MTSADWRARNLADWEERTPIHLRSPPHDVSSHRAGRGRLDPIVEAEIGDAAGLPIVHLQCHRGDDGIALAQCGAAWGLGVDASPSAIAAARARGRGRRRRGSLRAVGCAGGAGGSAAGGRPARPGVHRPGHDRLAAGHRALGAAGFVLDWLHEHPRLARALFRGCVRDAEGMRSWPDGDGCRWR